MARTREIIAGVKRDHAVLDHVAYAELTVERAGKAVADLERATGRWTRKDALTAIAGYLAAAFVTAVETYREKQD